MSNEVRAVAPGRVNLIGDHVDYLGGPVLPMAIQLGTTVTGQRGGDRIVVRSTELDGEVDIDLPVRDPSVVEPSWGRYIAGVAAELGTDRGFTGSVTSTVPVGSGLSSSAALEVAMAVALGASTNDVLGLASLARAAEQRATGVPCGIMDQLASAAGREDHALLIDCHTLEVTPVAVPDGAAIWVLHSGQARTLAGSAYAERRAATEAAERIVGPLRTAGEAALDAIEDPTLAARARHVVSECARVRSFVDALSAADLEAAGRLMVESHRSLAGDFEVSTPVLDHLVDTLVASDGVYGARLTGAGFGGCVVALARPGCDLSDLGSAAWPVVASAGARLL